MASAWKAYLLVYNNYIILVWTNYTIIMSRPHKSPFIPIPHLVPQQPCGNGSVCKKITWTERVGRAGIWIQGSLRPEPGLPFTQPSPFHLSRAYQHEHQTWPLGPFCFFFNNFIVHFSIFIETKISSISVIHYLCPCYCSIPVVTIHMMFYLVVIRI